MPGRAVSVIVPTHDRPAYLRQALASIRALESEDLAFEVLVGDNGSTPETPKAAEEFGARYFKVNRNGAGAARNAALAAATGDYIAFLDDDDVWLSDNIRGQLSVLEANPELEGVFGQVVCTDQDLHPTMAAWPSDPPGEGDDLVRAVLSGYYPQLGATVVRSAAARAIGTFDESLLGDQDWDWHVRLVRRRKVGFIARHCVLFRQRPVSTFDALRLRRLGFARRVFFRHAWPERSLWRDPTGFMRAYTEVLWQYYSYFTQAAAEHARSGDREAARRAIWGAFRTFPLRAAYHVLTPRPLQAAFMSAIFGQAVRA